MTSYCPEDILQKYCGNCHQWHAMFLHQEPIHYNAIVLALEEKVQSHLKDGTPFSLQMEHWHDDGRKYYRALIKLGNGVWKHTRRQQLTPTDALRELSEIMDAGL
jgi:hypothetical protein